MGNRSLAAVTRAGPLLLAWLGCATTGPAVISSDEPCTTAAECAMTNFAGCCGCPSEPTATNRSMLEFNEKACAVICCQRSGDSSEPCPRVLNARGWDAACIQGRCAGISR